MKKIALFMSALALMVFASCDNNDGPNLDDVVEDGFFVAGPATGSDVLEAKFMMTAGFNEVTKAARDGMYEKYIVLEAGKDFYLTLNEAGESLRYGAALEDVNLAERTDQAAYADNPAIVIRKGKLIEGPEAPAMSVNETGLYHIVLDLNKEGDLEFPQIIVVPCKFMLKGGIGDKEMTLSVDGDKYIYTYQGTGHQDANTFKFACCNGWKITLDIDGNVKAETSLGVGLQPNGGDIPLNPGDDIQIILTFKAAAGDHSKSFSYKFVNVLENYGPADFTVGIVGDLHSSLPQWGNPTGVQKGVYNAEESNAATGTYVYDVTGCPIKEGAKFKMRRDGDWVGGDTSYFTYEGVQLSGTGDFAFGSQAGLYNIKITIVWNGTATTSYKAVFTRTGDLPADVTPEQPETPVETMKFIVKVNKAIDWYDKYFYAWADGVSFPGWPGVKMDFQGEEGDYYVYYTMIPKSLDGKTLNYIINNNGSAQTKDLSIAINGETTATVEAADKK